MLKLLRQIALIATVFLAPSGCRNADNQVPYVLVDITLLLDLPSFTALTTPGGSEEITGGSMGIVVYRINLQDFAAFDRHCTHNVNDFCRIQTDEETGVTAVCECCASVFSIIDGTPIEGPAARSLLRYNTTFNGNTNQLRIFN